MASQMPVAHARPISRMRSFGLFFFLFNETLAWTLSEKGSDAIFASVQDFHGSIS